MASRITVIIVLGGLSLFTMIWIAVHRHGFEPMTYAAAFMTAFVATYFLWRIASFMYPAGENMERWNRRIHSGLGWFLLCAVGLLTVGYLARPGSHMDEDAVKIHQSLVYSVLIHELSKTAPHTHDETTFIRLPGNASPGPVFFDTLHEALPDQCFAPWSMRPPVDPRTKEYYLDHYLALDNLSLPFWRVARARLSTSTCSWEVIAVRGVSGRWRMFNTAGMCFTPALPLSVEKMSPSMPAHCRTPSN